MISKQSTGRTPVLTGVELAALWLLLALVSDGTTYHLAPLLVAGIPATLHAFENEARSIGRSAGLAVLGAVAALAVGLVLAVSGNLDGPSLLPFGGAVAESAIFIAVGVAAGLAIGFLRNTKGGI